MRKEIAEVWTKEAVNLITYGDSDNPHATLGRHRIERGQIISSYHPYATKMEIVLENGTIYPMETVERTKVYSTFIPMEEEFSYQIRMSLEEGKIQTVRDPYCFKAQISDLDQFLFSQGMHYEIYKKLGAHPMKINGIEGVYFAVWAPNAKRVSVVGDFNIWDGRIHAMRRLGESGIFEIFIPDIEVGELYKYEIKTKTGAIFLKADPYANMAEVCPCTASIVVDRKAYQWRDRWWMEQREKKNCDEEPMAIYEVHLGSWMRKGEENQVLSYRELAEKLVSYVVDMGYTHIELMGIMEHPLDSFWGYEVTGYYSPTSRYGSLEDFMYFIDCFHTKGIGVILDWVPGYFAKNDYSLVKFDGTCLYEHPNLSRGNHLANDGMIFHYERNQVKNFLIGSALFWIRDCHIDGLRVGGVSSMLYFDFDMRENQWQKNGCGGREFTAAIEFLKHLNFTVGKYGEGGFIIAEEATVWDGVTRPLQDGGLGFSYKWNMGWIHDFMEYMKIEPWGRKYKHRNLTFGMHYAYSEKFILSLSHDEVGGKKRSMLNKMPGEYLDHFTNLRIAYGFMFTHPGKKLLFMGQDFAQWGNWNENQSLDWHLLEQDIHQKMRQYVKDLLHLYCSHKALYELDYAREGFEWINCSDAEHSIVSFIRRAKSKEETLLVVCNFLSVARLSFRIGVPETGIYELLFSSEDEKYGGEECYRNGRICSEEIYWDGRENSIKINLPPLSILIFQQKQ